MRTTNTLERPTARRPGHVKPWIELSAWLLAFALLLAAPCAPQPPMAGGTPANGSGAPLSAQRGDAPARR